MNQNEWRKNPSEEWKINTSGTNDFKKATNYSYGRTSPVIQSIQSDAMS